MVSSLSRVKTEIAESWFPSLSSLPRSYLNVLEPALRRRNQPHPRARGWGRLGLSRVKTEIAESWFPSLSSLRRSYLNVLEPALRRRNQPHPRARGWGRLRLL